MRFVLSLILLVLALGAPAHARTVTDHADRTVTIPDQPARIVSLHDWTLTVMAHELGAPVIASAGRMAADGSFYIRGGRELFDLDFTRIELASVHGKPDLERIRALKPDLILANVGDYAAIEPQLSTIAPTLLFNPERGQTMLELYAELADWLGRTPRFEELRAAYQTASANMREKLGARGSYIALLVNGRDGTIDVLKEYGALTTVLDDLGLTRMPIVNDMAPGTSRMRIGAELLDQIDADYIVTSYLPEQGEGAQTIHSDIDRVAPGGRDFLQAFVNGRVLSLSRYEVYPPTFKGLDVTLEAIGTYLGKQ